MTIDTRVRAAEVPVTELVARAGRAADTLRCAHDLRADRAAAGWTLLSSDDRSDVWLVGWQPGDTTGLHDRGTSAGAMVVVAGTLTELLPRGWSDGWMHLGATEHAAASIVGFDRHRIHALANRSASPALTVHAFSPPLRELRRYDVAGGELVPAGTSTLRGALTATRTEAPNDTLRRAS